MTDISKLKRKLKKKRGVGSPPSSFSKAEKRCWKRHATTNKYLRREHREFLRTLVKVSVAYERGLKRFEKMIERRGTPPSQIRKQQQFLALLNSRSKHCETQLLRITANGSKPKGRRVMSKPINLRGEEESSDKEDSKSRFFD